MAALGIGVSIGSKTVRVLQVKKDKAGTWSVVRALSAPLRGGNIAAETRAALTSAQVKGKALVGLTGRDLIVRYTQVPPVPDWRLEMLMNFEIEEVSEQSGGDVSAAYALMDVDDTTTGDNVVLVALAKNQYLNPRLAALKAAGVQALGGSPRALGAFWAYKENGHLRFDETVVIMHVGHENTDVAVARNGSLLFARNVSGGSKMFTDALVANMRVNQATAEKMKVTKGNLTPRGKARYHDSTEEKIANNLLTAAGHFVSAFNSSVMFAKAQTKVPDVRPDRVVVMGSGALLRGFPEYLENALGLPVELFDPLDDLDLSALSQEAADALRQEQGGVAVTLGLAQMAADPGALRVEVLPPEEKKKRRFMEETVFTIAAGALLVVALIVAFVTSGQAEETGGTEVAKLQEVQSTYDKSRQEFNKASETVTLLNDEKFRLRRLIAMAPAFQDITDAVQGVVGGSQNPDQQPFDEIFIRKVMANMKTFQRDDVQVEVPTVEFHAEIQSVGIRTVPAAYSEFTTRLKRLLRTKRDHLSFHEMGGLDQKGVFFKFRIEQDRFPEKAKEAAAEDAAEDEDK